MRTKYLPRVITNDLEPMKIAFQMADGSVQTSPTDISANRGILSIMKVPLTASTNANDRAFTYIKRFNDDKFLLFSRYGSTSNQWGVSLVSVDADGNQTYLGSPVVFTTVSNTFKMNPEIELVSQTGNDYYFILQYCYDGGNNLRYLRARGLKISENVISLGTEINVPNDTASTGNCYVLKKIQDNMVVSVYTYSQLWAVIVTLDTATLALSATLKTQLGTQTHYDCNLSIYSTITPGVFIITSVNTSRQAHFTIIGAESTAISLKQSLTSSCTLKNKSVRNGNPALEYVDAHYSTFKVKSGVAEYIALIYEGTNPVNNTEVLYGLLVPITGVALMESEWVKSILLNSEEKMLIPLMPDNEETIKLEDNAELFISPDKGNIYALSLSNKVLTIRFVDTFNGGCVYSMGNNDKGRYSTGAGTLSYRQLFPVRISGNRIVLLSYARGFSDWFPFYTIVMECNKFQPIPLGIVDDLRRVVTHGVVSGYNNLSVGSYYGYNKTTGELEVIDTIPLLTKQSPIMVAISSRQLLVSAYRSEGGLV